MVRGQPALEGLRSQAAAAVVALHAAALQLGLTPRADSPDWWAANLLDSATRWCVPVFVMISGALLLGRADPPADFLRRRLGRLLPLLLVWSLLYLGLQALTTPGWQPAHAWQAFLRGTPWYHLWYLCMLPGLYLLMPLLQRLLTGFSGWKLPLVAILLLSLISWMLPPAASAWWRAPAFLAPCVAGLLLQRAWLAHEPVRRLSTALAWPVFGLTTAGIALMAARGDSAVAYDYANPLVLLQAAAVFLQGLGGTGRWRQKLAPLSLGIYLIHPAILLALTPWLGGGGVLRLLPLALLTFALSALLTAGLLRLPGSRRWLA
ncbi:acyltransferase [Uliginosibacterium paludis]|uniref:Acyltransferase family protein n=1 Tax=Uliginosibacterium paludis TaxID=1615952 RepID=A0ABV2CV62_9RHOO